MANATSVQGCAAETACASRRQTDKGGCVRMRACSGHNNGLQSSSDDKRSIFWKPPYFSAHKLSPPTTTTTETLPIFQPHCFRQQRPRSLEPTSHKRSFRPSCTSPPSSPQLSLPLSLPLCHRPPQRTLRIPQRPTAVAATATLLLHLQALALALEATTPVHTADTTPHRLLRSTRSPTAPRQAAEHCQPGLALPHRQLDLLASWHPLVAPASLSVAPLPWVSSSSAVSHSLFKRRFNASQRDCLHLQHGEGQRYWRSIGHSGGINAANDYMAKASHNKATHQMICGTTHCTMEGTEQESESPPG